MLKLAEYTQRSSILKEKVISTLSELNAGFSIDDNNSRAIRLVFVGQYSAGKSSIIKMLTGRKDITIGAGITTQRVHKYIWNSLEVIDTPGIHTELRQDHDDISYEAIASADVLVFVVTNELFDSHISEHFRKLAVDKDKASEMILVVNKMERTENGNSESQRAIIQADLRKVLEPYTPEQFYLSFLDTCTMQEVTEGFRFCECGRYEMDPKGIENTGGMLATAGSFLLPEIQAALASLGTLVKGVAVAGGSGVVCGLLVVGGIYGVIKLTTNLSATKVKVEVLSVTTALKDFDELEDDAYYIARSNDKSGACKLYYWPYALDEEGACNYLTALAIAKSKPSFFFMNDKDQLTGLNGIYAKTKQSAEKLAKAYDARGSLYGYGRCKSPDHMSEVNKSDKCYEHYHVFYRGIVTSSFHKVDDVHIFFDIPTLHPDYVKS